MDASNGTPVPARATAWIDSWGDPSRRLEAALRRLRCESGQTLVMVTLTLPVLLGVSALVIDIGNMYVQKRTLQTAADSAAIAAAQDLATGDKTTGAACTSACVSALAGKYTAVNGGARRRPLSSPVRPA